MSGDGYGGSGDADRSLVAVIVLSVVAMLLTPMLGCDRACDDAADGVTAILVALFSRW